MAIFFYSFGLRSSEEELVHTRAVDLFATLMTLSDILSKVQPVRYHENGIICHLAKYNTFATLSTLSNVQHFRCSQDVIRYP